MKPTTLSTERLDALQTHLREDGVPFALATVVRTQDATSAKAGAKAVVSAEGDILEGWVGGGCARSAIARGAKQAIATNSPVYVALRPDDRLKAEDLCHGQSKDGIFYARNGCASRGSMDIFIDPVVPVPDLVVMGDGPVARALVSLAGRFDFRCIQAARDLDRTQDSAADLAIDSFDLPAKGVQDRFVVIATQGKGDEAALTAVLASEPTYTAFVGSSRKFQTLRDRLVEKGADPAALDAVSAPAGLEIGAAIAEEIALSILAEVVARRRAGRPPAERPA
ncbi:MAG: XdhC family protein [Rhodobacteraceae bacterium]|nr:XdhC family protein [Paracoccaceae bacterium]